MEDTHSLVSKKKTEIYQDIQVQLWNNNKNSWDVRSDSMDIGGRYLSLEVAQASWTLDMYGRKWPSFYSALSKQDLLSQSNVDAVCWYSVFWPA